MSAHSEAPAAHAPDAAPAAPAAVASSSSGYLSRVAGGVKNGLLNTVGGPFMEVGKALVDPTAQHPWAKSVLAPIAGAAGIMARPFTAVKETFYHGGHWGFEPGRGWTELAEMVRTPVHAGIDFVRKGVSAALSAADRCVFGLGELVAAPGGQSAPASSLWKLPLDSSSCVRNTW